MSGTKGGTNIGQDKESDMSLVDCIKDACKCMSEEQLSMSEEQQ